MLSNLYLKSLVKTTPGKFYNNSKTCTSGYTLITATFLTLTDLKNYKLSLPQLSLSN